MRILIDGRKCCLTWEDAEQESQLSIAGTVSSDNQVGTEFGTRPAISAKRERATGGAPSRSPIRSGYPSIPLTTVSSRLARRPALRTNTPRSVRPR